jgi:hypothetical protein
VLALLTACAPSQSFRPAGSVREGRRYELGVALSNVRPRPYVNETTQSVGQAWWTLMLREPWSMTVIAGFDSSSALAGAALRLDALRTRYVKISPEAELGFAWGALGLPVSLEPYRGVVIYTAPRIGNWGDEVTPFIPLGLGGELFGGFVLRAEVQVSWAEFQYYNRRVHWGFAAAQQW